MITRRRLLNRSATLTPSQHRQTDRPENTTHQWYRIVNATTGTPAEIYLYDEIGLWGVTAATLVNELAMLDAANIDLHVNSPGGDVFDGIAIYNALCNHPATVTTYIDGLAASAASFIAQAGSEVLIARNGTMMIHDAEGICIGNAADMTEMADLLDRASDNIADIYAQRASTVLQWRKKMRAVSWYTGKEAVDAGLADKVYQPEPGTDDEPVERRRPAARNSAPRPVAPVTRSDRPQATVCPSHSTATVDTTWDGGANEKRLPVPVPVAKVRQMYGWYDSEQADSDGLPKTACKLPHHEVDADGNPGAANLAGCRNALSRLPQSDIPESDHDAVRAHLNKHLDDGDSGTDDHHDPGMAAAWDPGLIRTVVAQATREVTHPEFNASAFQLAMSTAAVNAPAVPDDPPRPPTLPAMLPPAPPVCGGCQRPLEASVGPLSPATVQQIMRDVAHNCPAVPDDPRVVPDLGEPVPPFDRANFHDAIRRGLL